MNTSDLTSQVAAILQQVQQQGDKALLYYTEKFDGILLKKKTLRVSHEEIRRAEKELEPALKRAIDGAADNIRRFHQLELKHMRLSWRDTKNGVTLGQTFSPVQKVGIYVPGGRFSYPSTVLMAAIPARVAGAETVVMVTPPKKITAAVLYAAAVSGIDAVYRVGGAQSIGALAYGTDIIPQVDIIAGPGNAYVNEAKRLVYGTVGIDSLAGPSEVAIIADSAVVPAYVAEDLQAQAEHDPMARAYLFATAKGLKEKVMALVPANVRNQVVAEYCTIDEAVSRVNRLAPEHLELLVKDPEKFAKKIRNAGAVFAGCSTPTAAGDYWAGPSHVLPTGRTARFASGLSVATFIKRSSYISCRQNALEKVGSSIVKLAESEGLLHHGRSVVVRTDRPVRKG
jgi:histidinol dehydrogenase